jgi:hypothetical protein
MSNVLVEQEVEERATRVLSNETILTIAEAHGVSARLNRGRVELLEEAAFNGEWERIWRNASGWTVRDLMAWLGY